MNTQKQQNASRNYYANIIIALLIIFFTSLNIFAQQEVEVKGNITELGSYYLVVQNLQFYIDKNTEFKDEDNNGFSFESLEVGELVEVKGYSQSDGSYLAKRVESEDDSDDDDNSSEFEVKGHVTNLGENSIELNGYIFLVTENTEYDGRSGSTFSFEQISIGDFLEIEAYKTVNGDLIAVEVEMEDNFDDYHHGNEVEITGKIDNILNNKIVLGAWEFSINDQTIIIDRNKTLISFSDLSINDLVEVKAYKQADGSFLAIRIKFEDNSSFDDNSEIELTAQIEDFGASSLTVRGLTFSYDQNTVFLDYNRIAADPASFTVGMLVEVKGYKNSDGSYYASRVKIEDFFNNEVELKGNIDELTDSYIIVNTVKFLVNGSTIVLDNNNIPNDYSSLAVGQLVEIKGYKTNGTDLTAVRIKMEDGDDLELYGSITAIFSTYFELNGLVITIDNTTSYLNHLNQNISYSDLEVGFFVEVKFIVNPDGSAKATRVKIEDLPGFITVIGSIGSVSNSNIQLELSDFKINASTVVLDKSYKVISANELTSGESVTLWVDATESSNPVVLQILSKVNSITSAKTGIIVEKSFELQQNYPNPFNPTTNISFLLQNSEFVSLKIFNAIGQEVKTLVNENMSAGSHTVEFNATDFTSGIYFYRLESGNTVSIKKMMLMK
jgi:hypothetical protein